MSFAQIKQKPEFKGGDFKKVEYIELTPGAHTIRILNDKALDVDTHYLGRVSVRCLGEDCPICANNKAIISNFPKDFSKQPGYNKRTERHYVNVLDKTPAKVCPNCGKEHKDVSMLFCTCGTQLPQHASPLNKVKLLAKGRTLFEHLETIHNTMLDAEGTPIGVNNFDITIVVSGSGRDVTYTPIPNPAANAAVPDEVKAEMYDLDKAIISLEASEMLDLQRGTSLKDIFSARRASEKQVVTEPVVNDETLKSVQAEVNALFGN